MGKDIEQMPEMIKFKCLVNNDYKDVIAYTSIVDYIKQDVDEIISIMKIELVTEVIQMSHAPELYV